MVLKTNPPQSSCKTQAFPHPQTLEVASVCVGDIVDKVVIISVTSWKLPVTITIAARMLIFTRSRN